MTTPLVTKRWPLSLYFNMIDITALAAYIVYYENNTILAKKNSSQRKIFLRKLAEELCMPVMEQRSANNQIMRHFSTKIAMDCYIRRQVDPLILEPSTSSGRRSHGFTGTCYLCHLQEANRSRKTRKSCCICGKPMCLQHSVTNCMCVLCANK